MIAHCTLQSLTPQESAGHTSYGFTLDVTQPRNQDAAFQGFYIVTIVHCNHSRDHIITVAEQWSHTCYVLCCQRSCEIHIPNTEVTDCFHDAMMPSRNPEATEMSSNLLVWLC